MQCTTCHSETARVRIIKGREYCSKCGGFSEANGTRIDGVLSRQRVRGEAVKYEGDTINPWVYDKHSRGFEPNQDFIKLHSNNAMNFYTKGDLKNYPKLKDKLHDRIKENIPVGSVGDTEPTVTKVFKEAI